MGSLVQFVGSYEFAVELVAAELLFFVCLPRRSHFPLRAVAAVLLLAAASRLLMPVLAISFGMIVWCSVILLVSALALWFCFDERPAKVALYVVCGYAIQHLSYTLHAIIALGVADVRGCAPFLGFGGSAPEEATLTNVALLLAVFVATYVVAYRFYAARIAGCGAPDDLPQILVFSCGMLLIVMVFSVLRNGLPPFEALVCHVLSALGCVLGLAYIRESLCGRSARMDLELMRRQQLRNERYYELLKDSIEATNRRCHDYKRRLIALMEEGRDLGTLSSLADSISVYDSIAKTGNESLDAVLTDKSLVCQREGIRFTYMADGEALRLFDDADLYSLFGNALDNAIEASCNIVETGSRAINLTATVRGPFLVIRVINRYAGELAMGRDGLPASTASRGLGMRSMQGVAEKYCGNLMVSAREGVFSLSVTVPLPSAVV